MIADSILTVGIDEVGRGSLCGDVFAAAVAFPATIPEGITDSKKLTPSRRLALADAIQASALIGIGRVTSAEIDSINILRATLLAMRRAFAALPTGNYSALVDGNSDPELGVPTKTVVKGDLHHAQISAASIIAKTQRDAYMDALHVEHPVYDWISNKGYGTAKHLSSLREYGPSPYHRMTFAPLQQPELAL